ncbi:hypothetical protein [Paenibacillus oceani]|uniref:Uncharacterized protein n=1 Tax=Paenibacillus oceani TaxID=2772510 RepID=A0A927CAB4_9BACL|nr:hypothetical protein [Paenibacillus oceani]MBD2862361.1 hypothetical protein [Paenibacillus oceani]
MNEEHPNRSDSISRRKLLASMGAAGASFAVGGLLHARTLDPAPEGKVTDSVYGAGFENKGGNATGIRRVAEQVVEENVPAMIQELAPPLVAAMLDETCLQTTTIQELRLMTAAPTAGICTGKGSTASTIRFRLRYWPIIPGIASGCPMGTT